MKKILILLVVLVVVGLVIADMYYWNIVISDNKEIKELVRFDEDKV